MTHDSFLSAILSDPDDDTPRLVYADWLEERGDPRGEFIRIQCRLARLPANDPQRSELKAREQQLLKEHGAEWKEPLRKLGANAWFSRGFVESIGIDAVDLLKHEKDIFALAPVATVGLGPDWSDRDDIYSRLNCCYSLLKVKYVELIYDGYNINDEELQSLARQPLLLQRLSMVVAKLCDISEVGLGPVFASPYLLKLEDLYLTRCDLHGEAGVRFLVEQSGLPKMRFLSLPEHDLGDSGVEVLARWSGCHGLENLDLEWCEVSNEGAIALARSPYLVRLRFLRLASNPITDLGADALARSPYLGHLEHLSLSGKNIGASCKERLKARFGERVILV